MNKSPQEIELSCMIVNKKNMSKNQFLIMCLYNSRLQLWTDIVRSYHSFMVKVIPYLNDRLDMARQGPKYRC